MYAFLRFYFFFLFLAPTLLNAQGPQAFSVSSPEDAGFSSERLQRLDAWMQEYVDKGIVPNAVAFIARRGKVFYYKGVGYSNIEKKTPVKKDDIYRIASQSKALTSIAAMMLYEEGKFLLDEPISKYIPAFKNPTVLVSFDEKDRKRYITRPAKSEITIRQLLTHTAGIPYEHPLQDLPEFKVPFFNSLDNETLADVIPRLAKRPLLHDPGEAFTYGLNSDVLGYLVEILSGTSFSDFLNKKIIQPLGMTDTYFYLPQEKTSRLVELYSKTKADDPLTVHANTAYRNFAVSGEKTYFSGGAGLVSTASDYAKICQLMLNEGMFNGRRLLSPETVKMMTRNQIGALEVWDRKDKFGFGFSVSNENTHYYDPAQPGAYGWGGMYCSEYTIDPKEEVIMLIFTNIHPFAQYGDFVRKFRILTYQALEKSYSAK